ncbi:MAG: HNH endonuclease [Gammaproteobacteria bacterium]|uniref:Putative DNA binding, helix-turn-helix domain containing protein n=1 Tax=viral metagenome TaxID=1070528 RepID=A0A6M3ISD8_9ZZZZ|nr:HNH endonuclease [Gammaproteobacteria bacterium]
MNKNDIERFWSKVDKSGTCWIWKAAIQNKGYGQFWLDYRMQLAHRISYEIHFGMFHGNLMHKCDNPLCVNPSHLIKGNQSDNLMDMFRKNRQVKQDGENGPRAILTEENVLEIRKLRNEGKTNVELGKLYSVHPGTISKAFTGKNWSHV